MNEPSRLSHPDLEPLTSSDEQPQAAPEPIRQLPDPTAAWRNDLSNAMSQIAQTQELMRMQMQSQNSNQRSAFAEFEQSGIQPHVMRAAIEEIVGPEVQRRVGEALQPFAQALQAEAAMEQQYPEFRKAQSVVMKHIQDEGLGNRFQHMMAADPQGAMEWAMSRYERSQGPIKRESAADDPDAARIPRKTAASNSRSTAPDDAEEIRNGYANYKQNGDVKPLLRARFRSILPDSHFNER